METKADKDIRRVSFIEFLAEEEHNLLASMSNFRREFDFFFNLDEVYKAPLGRLSPSYEDAMIPQLYLFVHYHLFSAVSSVLRVHLADAFGQTRKGIDGALTAYEIIENPGAAKDYINRDRRFLNIKNTIEKARKANPEKYPRAAELIVLHSKCSEYGSHADFTSFAHRMRFLNGKSGEQIITFDYFQKPENEFEFRFYFLLVLHCFLLMFDIFRLFFDKELKILDVAWEAKIAKLHEIIPAARRAAYEKSEIVI